MKKIILAILAFTFVACSAPQVTPPAPTLTPTSAPIYQPAPFLKTAVSLPSESPTNVPEYTNFNTVDPVSEYWLEYGIINDAFARYSVQLSEGKTVLAEGATQEEANNQFIEMMKDVKAKICQVESPDGNQMVSVAVTEDANGNQTMYIGVDKASRLPFARPDGWMFDPENSDVVARPLPKDTVYGGQWSADSTNYYSFAVDPATGKALFWFDTTNKEGDFVPVETRPILVGFDPKMNTLMEGMAEAPITYKPLINEQGGELKQGILYREDVGSGETFYVSATVRGLVDLEKAYPGEFADSHAVIVQVERDDGTKVLFPIEFPRGSEKDSMQVTTAYLQGTVSEGIIGTKWEIVRTTFYERYDYFVQKLPSMLGQQIIVSLPRAYDTSSEQYKSVQKVLDAINGVNSDDVEVGYENLAERFPENKSFVIPDDGTRP